MRPTFNGSALGIETHLLDAQLAATPKRMEVRFWKRLREEKKFSSPEELRAQIASDIARANNSSRACAAPVQSFLSLSSETRSPVFGERR